MKKFAIVSLFILLSLGTANAFTFDWSLPGGYEASVPLLGISMGTTVNGINTLGFSTVGDNWTTINQSFAGGPGSPTVLGSGDTFTEFGFLGQVDINGSPINFQNSSGTPYGMYVKFSGLSGAIANYTNAGGDVTTTDLQYLGDANYDLNFTPGVGSIQLYLALPASPNTPAQTMGNFLLASGSGTSPVSVLNSLEGQFGIVVSFKDVPAGVWKFTDGTNFEDFSYGLSNISLASDNLGATLKTTPSVSGDTLNFGVLNKGNFQASAVPEPATLLLLGFGIIGLASVARKKISS